MRKLLIAATLAASTLATSAVAQKPWHTAINGRGVCATSTDDGEFGFALTKGDFRGKPYWQLVAMKMSWHLKKRVVADAEPLMITVTRNGGKIYSRAGAAYVPQAGPYMVIETAGTNAFRDAVMRGDRITLRLLEEGAAPFFTFSLEGSAGALQELAGCLRSQGYDMNKDFVETPDPLQRKRRATYDPLERRS